MSKLCIVIDIRPLNGNSNTHSLYCQSEICGTTAFRPHDVKFLDKNPNDILKVWYIMVAQWLALLFLVRSPHLRLVEQNIHFAEFLFSHKQTTKLTLNEQNRWHWNSNSVFSLGPRTNFVQSYFYLMDRIWCLQSSRMINNEPSSVYELLFEKADLLNLECNPSTNKDEMDNANL